jgi:glycerol-3-phosphate dehydrogenase (NAD(P)+)
MIGVIGAGAWGTALACMLARDGTRVTLWARSPDLAATINATRANPAYLPGATIAPGVRATSDLAELAALPVVLVVCPAQAVGTVLAGLPPAPAGMVQDLLLCAKGIEAGSARTMAQVAQALRPAASVAVLSGPTFAREVAQGLPTAVTLGCSGGQAQWQRLAPAIARAAFRPYYSDDVVGCEVGGAIKNVLAIACGVVDGLGLGENARAALIARGYAEMLRFGVALGARPETLAGLCGLGDLVLTCSSVASRNYSLGKALGLGQTTANALAGKASVAEGAHTAPVLAELAATRAIAMPIVDAVCRLLRGEAPAGVVVSQLLARPLKAEWAQGPADGLAGAAASSPDTAASSQGVAPIA